MKSIKLLLSILALGVVASSLTLRAQDNSTPAPAPTPPADQGGKGGGKGGRGGRGQMSPEQRVAAIDKAVTLTDDEKTKITAI